MTGRWLLKGITKVRGAVHNERGATAVEFALVAPIFLIFVIGIIDLGRLFYIKNIMQSTVEQSARYAMVNASASQAALEAYAAARAASLFSGITFVADVPGTDVVAGVNYRTITATYTFSYMTPIVTVGDVPLTAKSRIPVNSP